MTCKDCKVAKRQDDVYPGLKYDDVILCPLHALTDQLAEALRDMHERDMPCVGCAVTRLLVLYDRLKGER